MNSSGYLCTTKLNIKESEILHTKCVNINEVCKICNTNLLHNSYFLINAVL